MDSTNATCFYRKQNLNAEMGLNNEYVQLLFGQDDKQISKHVLFLNCILKKTKNSFAYISRQKI